MNWLAHSSSPVGMLHLEKWPIRWVNNKVVGLSSSQKRLRVLAANNEQSTSQQHAQAGESSSSSSLATAKGQGRAGVLPPPAQCLLGHTRTALREGLDQLQQAQHKLWDCQGWQRFPCWQGLWEQGLEKGWLRRTPKSSSSSTHGGGRGDGPSSSHGARW